MTTKPRKDAGTILVLLNRLNNERLPRAQELKKRVDRGECLCDYDMQFLKSVLADAGAAGALVATALHRGVIGPRELR